MSRKALLLTLGHNSSAIYTNGVDSPIGYEEERLTGVKSDSSFPKKAIEELIQNGADFEDATIFVSHWFDSEDLDSIHERFFDKMYIRRLRRTFNMGLISLMNFNTDQRLTHHDAHMFSGLAFLEHFADQPTQDMFHIVADGFGSRQEVLSIYHQQKSSGTPQLIHRAFGYENSLGLMYQFATAFTGMKENQDEYKFLGYESKIESVISIEKISDLKRCIEETAHQMFLDIVDRPHFASPDAEFIDLKALNRARNEFYEIFKLAIHISGIEDRFDYETDASRTVIGFFVQGVIERVLNLILGTYGIDNVTLTGGCFYNVKLNNSILKSIKGKICVMPIAGDQGAAIGLYRRFVGAFPFGDLCYGVRNLSDDISCDDPNYYRTDDSADFILEVVRLLKQNKIVNIVSGSMEFGPRALCNTSTLALPTKENVAYINKVNSRNSVMPMAPVSLEDRFKKVMKTPEDFDRVIGSDSFMVLTHDIKTHKALGVDSRGAKSSDMSGVVHSYPISGEFSARPQILSGPNRVFISRILKELDVDCLINTSFNNHGVPIVYRLQDALDDFDSQRLYDEDDKMHLIVYNGK